MSQFQFAATTEKTPTTIEVDTLLHWGLLAFIVLSILVVTYLLITKCTAYWSYRINKWRYGNKKKAESDEDDDEEE